MPFPGPKAHGGSGVGRMWAVARRKNVLLGQHHPPMCRVAQRTRLGVENWPWSRTNPKKPRNAHLGRRPLGGGQALAPPLNSISEWQLTKRHQLCQKRTGSERMVTKASVVAIQSSLASLSKSCSSESQKICSRFTQNCVKYRWPLFCKTCIVFVFCFFAYGF